MLSTIRQTWLWICFWCLRFTLPHSHSVIHKMLLQSVHPHARSAIYSSLQEVCFLPLLLFQMEALHSFLSEELLHSGIHLPVQYTVHNEVLLHTVLHRFLPEQEMLLPWLYHRDLLKRVFRDDLAVFSERCICYILDFHDVLLNFLLFPVSMVILPT